jgi:rhodanese-related sulfurtransferase
MSLTKEMVRKKMKSKDVVVLNVLPEDEFLKFHIKGSYNIPLSQNRDLFAQEVENRFGKDKIFITYSAGITCAAGPNAAQALKIRGFKALDYAGGVQEWSESRFPLEGFQARQPAPIR